MIPAVPPALPWRRNIVPDPILAGLIVPGLTRPGPIVPGRFLLYPHFPVVFSRNLR